MWAHSWCPHRGKAGGPGQAHRSSEGRSTLPRMRGIARRLGRLLIVAGVLAAAVAAGRAALARVAGEPGEPNRRGSFDTWPAVPLAPGRQPTEGSGLPTGG